MGRLRIFTAADHAAAGVLGPSAGTLVFQNHTGWEAAEPSNAVTNSTDGMRVAGVQWNQSGDFDTFVSGLAVNVALTVLSFGAFLALRRAYPPIFSHNVSTGRVKAKLPEGLLGWARAALSLTSEERSKSMGLDVAMAVEFHGLCARLMLQIAVPMIVVMAPLNLYFGDDSTVDRLSRIGMANLPYGHAGIYYLIVLVVWAVVLNTEASLRNAQARFLALRADWLHRQPLPRAATVLVEGIPPQHRSDGRLRAFFEEVFGAGSVRDARVMKRTGDLPELLAQLAAMKQARHKAELEYEKAGGEQDDRPLVRESLFGAWVDAIEHHGRVATDLRDAIATRRSSFLREAQSLGGSNMDLGFVTFGDRRAAEIAMVLKYTWNREEWRTSLPPEPSSVDWKSLTKARPFRHCSAAMGYLITAGLFLGFIPICLHITNLAITIDAGPLQPIWAAFAPTLGLLIFVSALPTVLLWIFQNFFTLYSDTGAQAHLQDWYFLFMIFFVVLVTAIGNDFSEFLRRVAEHPFSIFHLLADKLPYATHFYIHYLVLQWPTHVLHCLRPANLFRFLCARQLFEEEEARCLAEPEDQGYHGLGSRSARWAISAVVGIVFGTLSPLVPLLAGVEFGLCYVMFGYVLVFSETKKNDLGGAFWVKQLQHLRSGLLIYCVLMIGVLSARAHSKIPALLAAPTLVFVYWSYSHFDTKICTVGLPMVELAAREAAAKVVTISESGAAREDAPEDTGEVYVQPELLEQECS